MKMGESENMKKITINYENASDLLSKVSAFRTKQNCIRVTIGEKNLGNTLAAQIYIVNGGQMGKIGFKTSLPIGDEAALQLPYMSFNLKADDFCNYLSGLLGYQEDISLECEGAQIIMVVGDDEKARIPLNTIPDESCEPLLMQDYKHGWVQIEIKADDFLTLFRKGGFLSSSEADTVRQVTDRVVLKTQGMRCYMYSSDGSSIAKAWKDANVSYKDAQRALYYLRTKGAELSDEEKVSMLSEMDALKTDAAGMIAYANKHGYVSTENIQVSFPNACVSTIQKIISGVDELKIVITADNIHINAGNVLATFALAGEVASIYKNTVDPWENTNWSAKVVTDKESLVRALNILKLSGEDKVPFHIAVDAHGIATKKSGNEVHTTILATEGNTGVIDVYYSVKRVMDTLSTLSNGNLILRFMTENNNHPLSISNGSLDEKDIDAYAYILPVNLPKASDSNN